MFYWWNKVCHTNVWDAPALIINVLIFKAENNPTEGACLPSYCISPFLKTRPQLPESRAASHDARICIPKKMFTHPLFLLVCVNCFWLGARKPASAWACCATFPHQSNPPPPPTPASFHHAHEEKQSWHVSLMKSRAQSVGKELCFHTH